MPRRRTSESSPGSARSPKRVRRSDRIPESRTIRNGLLGNEISGRIRVLSDSSYVGHIPALREMDDDKASELRPRELQLYPSENKHAHHTDEYEVDELVLRRGQEFDLALTFDRPFDKETDTVILQLVTGTRPKESKGTLIRMEVAETYDTMSDEWQAKLLSVEEKTAEIRLSSPSDAIVGKYQIYVETLTVDGDNTYQNRKEFEESFILIFNPWCKGDTVYMEDNEKKAEYVLNETGRIWQGSSRRSWGKPWNFGQFEAASLQAALYLINKAEMMEGARSNPVQVSRTLSQMTNSNDEDGGVLEGRWTETYPKGTTLPWAWSGSVAILQEFMKTKKTVKFGQCWVFAGVLTTLCRSLGIPSRVISNFESAHDTDASMTIDYHWNEKDEPESDLNDSVWNFHVWSEAWFKRPDLPEGYDGWQAFDATPQEASEGVMKCGPSPVKAIKEGLVYLPYDTKFIFAEVNGDKVHWLIKDDGSSEVLGIEKRSVGINISTKAVGSEAREDVTLHYKYAEGSSEERNSVHRAFRHSSRKEFKVYKIKEADVKFDLISPENVTIGEDFELKVNMKNLTAEERNIHVRLTAIAAFYTGVPSEEVGTQEFTEKLEPNEEKTVTVPIESEVYLHILKPESIINVYLKGTVKETGRAYAHIDTIALSKPDIMVSVPEKVALHEEFEVAIHMTNPLREKVTGGMFYIEGRGFDLPYVVPYKKAIAPGEEIKVILKTSAGRSGNREIIANFVADQLAGMSGTGKVYVMYAAF